LGIPGGNCSVELEGAGFGGKTRYGELIFDGSVQCVAPRGWGAVSRLQVGDGRLSSRRVEWTAANLHTRWPSFWSWFTPHRFCPANVPTARGPARCLILEARDVAPSVIRGIPYSLVAMRVVCHVWPTAPFLRGSVPAIHLPRVFWGKEETPPRAVCALYESCRVVPIAWHGMKNYVWDERRGLLHSTG